MGKFELLTGKLEYKGIEFIFVFNKRELRLIPPADKVQDVFSWFTKLVGNGAYITNNPVYIEENYLKGYCNELNQRIIFFAKNCRIHRFNLGQSLKIDIETYSIQKYDGKENEINRLDFYSDEINYIFFFLVSLEYPEWLENGNISVKVKEFEKTTSVPKDFFVDSKRVKIFFSIFRGTSKQIGHAPLELRSSMIFEFDNTTDYSFILLLINIAKEFIQFLCYRKDIVFDNINMLSLCQDGKYMKVGTLYENDDFIDKEEKIFSRCINYKCIQGYEGKILNDIAEKKLYLRHIPISYKSGCFIDSARFIIIVTAFEWTFKQLYKEGVPKKDKTIKAENEVEIEVGKLRDEATGKKKDIYKFLYKLVRSTNLSTKIIQVGKDYSKILNNFGNWLYSKNEETLNYKKTGERLAEQRNHFAHGALDEEFIELSLLDLVFLEYIIYALQLKNYNIEDKKIKDAIKNLFGVPIASD